MPRSESWASAFLVGGALTMSQVVYYSAHYPTSNKGCDTSLPYWSWNGATAGAISGPFAGIAFAFTRYDTNAIKMPKFIAQSVITGIFAGAVFGGLVAQDYWKYTIVDRFWGDKCQPPHAPRRFPPVQLE